MGNARIGKAVIIENGPHIAEGGVEIDRRILAHIDED